MTPGVSDADENVAHSAKASVLKVGEMSVPQARGRS